MTATVTEAQIAALQTALRNAQQAVTILRGHVSDDAGEFLDDVEDDLQKATAVVAEIAGQK